MYRLEVLTQKVTSIEEDKVYSVVVLENVVKELKNEKAALIRENIALRVSNKILSYDMTDLKSKMPELKSEKLSLITAPTLLQSDHVPADEDKRIRDLGYKKKNLSLALGILQKDTVHTEQNNWEILKAKLNKVAPKIVTKPVTINTSNKYSILTVSDTEKDDIPDQQHSLPVKLVSRVTTLHNQND